MKPFPTTSASPGEGSPLTPTTTTVSIDTIIREASSFDEACKRLIGRYDNRGVTVVKEIYQSTNPKYDEAHQKGGEIVGFDREGVCCGMSLQWIRLTKNGQEIAFHQAINDDWIFFGNAQAELEMERHNITKDIKALIGQFEKNRSFIWDYERYMGFVDKAKNFLEYRRKLTEQEELEKKMEAQSKGVGEATNALYEKYIYLSTSDDLPAKRLKELFRDKALSVVAPTLTTYFSEPAFYYMELSGDGKHGIAFSTLDSGGGKARFMDPNSCDFRFSTLSVMNAFLDDYFQLYLKGNWMWMKNSTCSMLRLL
jgi:hypothetical protein